MSLAGLLMIFSGFLFSQANSFPSTTADTIVGKYKKAAKFGVFPFLVCLAISGVSVAWLLFPNVILFQFIWMGFIGLLFLTGMYGSWVFLCVLS